MDERTLTSTAGNQKSEQHTGSPPAAATKDFDSHGQLHDMPPAKKSTADDNGELLENGPGPSRTSKRLRTASSANVDMGDDTSQDGKEFPEYATALFHLALLEQFQGLAAQVQELRHEITCRGRNADVIEYIDRVTGGLSGKKDTSVLLRDVMDTRKGVKQLSQTAGQIKVDVLNVSGELEESKGKMADVEGTVDRINQTVLVVDDNLEHVQRDFTGLRERVDDMDTRLEELVGITEKSRDSTAAQLHEVKDMIRAMSATPVVISATPVLVFHGDPHHPHLHHPHPHHVHPHHAHPHD